MYNLTNATTATSIGEFLKDINVLSGGFYGVFFLGAFFIILFISLSRYDTKTAVVVPSFITTILGVLMVFLGLVGWSAVITTMVIMLAVIFLKMWSEE